MFGASRFKLLIGVLAFVGGTGVASLAHYVAKKKRLATELVANRVIYAGVVTAIHARGVQRGINNAARRTLLDGFIGNHVVAASTLVKGCPILKDIKEIGRAALLSAEERTAQLNGVVRAHLEGAATLLKGRKVLNEIRNRGLATLVHHEQRTIALQSMIGDHMRRVANRVKGSEVLTQIRNRGLATLAHHEQRKVALKSVIGDHLRRVATLVCRAQVLADIHALGRAAERRTEVLKGAIQTHLAMVLTIRTGQAVLAEIRELGQALLACQQQRARALTSFTGRHLQIVESKAALQGCLDSIKERGLERDAALAAINGTLSRRNLSIIQIFDANTSRESRGLRENMNRRTRIDNMNMSRIERRRTQSSFLLY